MFVRSYPLLPFIIGPDLYSGPDQFLFDPDIISFRQVFHVVGFQEISIIRFEWVHSQHPHQHSLT